MGDLNACGRGEFEERGGKCGAAAVGVGGDDAVAFWRDVIAFHGEVFAVEPDVERLHDALGGGLARREVKVRFAAVGVCGDVVEFFGLREIESGDERFDGVVEQRLFADRIKLGGLEFRVVNPHHFSIANGEARILSRDFAAELVGRVEGDGAVAEERFVEQRRDAFFVEVGFDGRMRGDGLLELCEERGFLRGRERLIGGAGVAANGERQRGEQRQDGG